MGRLDVGLDVEIVIQKRRKKDPDHKKRNV